MLFLWRGGIFITVEEIEILVTARIEEALKDIPKLVPVIKKTVEQAQEAFKNINTDTFRQKLHQAVQFAKKKIQDLKKSTQNNEIAIKVNNKEAKQQVTQLEKEIDSLQKKITARQLKLDITNTALDKIRDETNQSVVKEMPDAGTKRINKETYNRLDNNAEYMSLVKQSDKLNNEIMKYNSLLEISKSKMSQLAQETSQTATSQNRLTSFFSGFKGKLEQARGSIGNLKNSFSQMPKITQNITNNIKKMGTNIKSGLGHILKYATALFSIRGIYSILSQSAQSWLSSQNAGAQQLSANIEYMKYAMGSVFAPVIEYVINLVYQLMKAIQSVVYAFSGINIFAKATASSMKSASKGAKETSKSLAGVHNEINNISEKNGGSGDGSVSPNMDLSKVENMPNSILNAIKNGKWDEVGRLVGEKINKALEKIDWGKIQNTAKNIAINIGKFINGFVNGLDWNLLGSTIGEGINTALIFADTLLTTTNFKNIGISIANLLNSKIRTIDWNLLGKTFADGINSIINIGYGFVTTFNWKNFGTSIGSSINSFFKNIDWAKAGKTLSEGIKGIFNSITSFFQNFDWSAIIDGLIDFFTNIDWSGVVSSMFEALGSACASFVNLGMIIGEYINQAFDNIGQYFQEKIEECGGDVVAGVLKGIKDAIVGIGQWIYDNIFKPFIEGFKNAFGIHSPSTVMAEMGGYIIEGLKNGLSGIWNSVSSIFINLVSKVGEKFTEIKTNIKNWAENTTETVKGWIENTKTKIQEGWTNISNNIKEKITNVKTNISNGLNNAKETIGTWVNNAKNKMSDCWNNISNTVLNKLNTTKSNISTSLNNAKTTITNWGNNIKTSWQQTWNTMATKVQSGLNTAKSYITNWGNSAKSIFSNLGKNAVTWGKDLISNMASGIRNNISRVTSAVSSVASKIKSLLGFSEPEEGPLSNFHTYMPDMIDLMATGIRNNIGKVTKELENLTSTMSYTINTPDIKPLSISKNELDTNSTAPQSIIYDTMRRAIEDTEFYGDNNGQPLNITVILGKEKLGQILIEDLRDKTRRTGKNIEALIGG